MPITSILSVAPFIVVALIAITFHEAAHAITAAACGDDTAKRLGRASLNPIRHVDLVGTILLPGFLYAVHAPFLFGWAKPVPVNWSNLRHWRRDMVLVAAAGPAANFTYEYRVLTERYGDMAVPVLFPWINMRCIGDAVALGIG